MELFDAEGVIGRRRCVPQWGIWRLDEFLAAMERYGISRALVYHALARDSDPRRGNDLLAEVLAKSAQLEASHVVEPTLETGTDAAREILGAMRQNGVRALRVFPHGHGYSGDTVMLGDIFWEAEGSRMPVFYHMEWTSPWGDQTCWDLVDRICGEHRRLRLVLMGVGSPGLRVLAKMFGRHKRLMVGLVSLRAWQTVETIDRMFGPERMLFATGMPENDPGAAIGMLMGADIPPAHTEQIASGNLKRLLDEVVV